MEKLVVICEGGIVQDIICTSPMEAIVIDFDEGIQQDDPHFTVLIAKDEKTGQEIIDEVWAAAYDVAVDKELVDELFEQVLEPETEEDNGHPE